MAAPKQPILFRKLTELTKDPENAREHGPDQIEQIADSIRRFGFTMPAAVDDVIRAGNGRYDACALIYEAGERIYLAPGKDHGGQMIPDGTMPCFDCTGWTEDERTAYALADNQTALNATWNEDKLRSQLDHLAGQDFDLGSLGFDDAAMEALDAVAAQGGARTLHELTDTEFRHADQFGVIVMCADEPEQKAVFERLRDEGLNVKVVVV